jgi:hypothetical protein
VVWDHFDGAAGHEVSVHWHLGCQIGKQDLSVGRVELEADGRCMLLEMIGGAVTMVKGEKQPLLGWRSQRYGSLEPCPVLKIHADATAPWRVLTVLWLGKPAAISTLEPLFDEFTIFIALVRPHLHGHIDRA